jgi:hypothetical protein
MPPNKLRQIIARPLDSFSLKDIQAVRQVLDSLARWPWTPQTILTRKNLKPTDIEFLAKSPELVAKLCHLLEELFSFIKDLEDRVTLDMKPHYEKGKCDDKVPE